MVRQVARARRPAGQEAHRPGVDRTGPAGGRLLHQAHGRGLAARASVIARRPGGEGRPARRDVRAAREWLRYVEEDRAVKPSTLRDYRSGLDHHLLPAFGERRLLDITATELERWRSTLRVSARTKNKLLIAVGGIYRRAQRVFGINVNPAAQVERLRERKQVDIDVFSPEEVWALVRAAESEQDATIFLAAAFTGLRRGELIALRWRDVDFAGAAIRVRASYALGQLSSPKSGKARAVPPGAGRRSGARPTGGRPRLDS